MRHEIKARVIIKSSGVDNRANSRLNEKKLGEYLPDLKAVMDAARYFRDAGFKVSPSKNSVDIKGSVTLFENVFGVNLLEHPEKASLSNMRVPHLLRNILSKLIFPGVWINSYKDDGLQ